MRVRRSLPIITATLLSAQSATSLCAQQPLRGYAPAAAAREREIETDAIGRPSPDSASEHSRVLSRETHVAGTPAQVRTRDYVVALMKSWGLDTEVRTYSVFMPQATAVHVYRVSPDPKELNLAEPPVPAIHHRGCRSTLR